ncbi:MAG: sigma-70 family RNA polymerase sigma factor [Balneolaceae bacterium]|nr:sigma-70 family RNA polymerase sigma factor [Balneolaceae bacterium]
MDYSELVQALEENDRENTNRLLQEIRPRLLRYLYVHMNAQREDALDCVQESLLVTVNAIREGRIRNPQQVFSYLITTCRNQYLKMISRRRERPYDEVPDTSYHAPGQLAALENRERFEILERCMDELKEEYREFIDYWFENPDTDGPTVADHFRISVNNAWIRKHRIIKQLNRCIDKKSKL